MKDFRPISLCNIVAKVIGRVMTNRLKGVLTRIISEIQSAFLQDMSQAYDRVEWRFLESIMLKLGLARTWVDWTMCLVSSVGPYMYARDAEERKALTGVKISRESPSISHILFADDAILFCKASIEEGREIVRILREYEESSGQKINLEKRSVSFDSTVSTRRRGERLRGWKGKLLSQAGKDVLIKSVTSAIPIFVMNCFNLGVRWKVGNGRSIDMWKEQWVPRITDFYLRGERDENGRWVSQLISDGHWNKEEVAKCVTGEDRIRVLAIPLSLRGGRDKWV
ncbi:hypothetical protein LIER_33113 [Lithospermum erythrorhizon]|uniref:Reverse transcriptase domain-containing protein n=1 Tax=Lithospermum erythrorhizon TaxID=34254 RepID=A0AAV3RZ66_LITER